MAVVIRLSARAGTKKRPWPIHDLHLVEVELEAALIVLRQQRIEVAETLDEAASRGKRELAATM